MHITDMTTYEFVPKSTAEVLQTKIEIWESRLAYAKQSDKNFVPECERALADLRAKLAAL